MPDGSGRELVTTWDYRPGSFTPLTQSTRTSLRDAPQEVIDGEFYTIITDLTGTPSELIAPDGALVGFQQHTLWGGTFWHPEGASTPLRFPGQYADPETGLHYNNQRYYDPVSGTYLSPDPLGLSPAPNPHAYVDNPHVLIDPLGLAADDAYGAAGTNGTGADPSGPFNPPDIAVNRHDQLSNGKYTLDSPGMDPHVNGAPGKSQFRFYVNSGKSVLDASSYADEYDLWIGNKAKVPTSDIVGYTGSGAPTSWINIYRTKSGLVHGAPGNSP